MLDMSSETANLSRSSQLSHNKKMLFERWTKGQKIIRDVIPKRYNSFFAPLSLAQQRLWLLEQLIGGQPVYNMHDAVRIQGKVDVQALKKALTVLVERHEILRTSFIVKEGTPTQKISAAPNEFDLPIEDVSNVDKKGREKRALEIAVEETKRPFDLEKGPLFRARLIVVSEDDFILLWTMHHIVSDGWSLGIIIKEIVTLSDAFSLNLNNSLPALPFQYGDFSEWQREQKNLSAREAQLAFWRNELQGELPLLSLPLDYPRPVTLNYEGDRCTETYTKTLLEDLKKLAYREGATLFMVLIAAFNVLLHRYSSNECILLGVPVANRNLPELNDLIGYFSNTVIIRADFSEQSTYRDLLKHIKQKSLKVFENQDISFEELVEELEPERSINITPLFQVMFVLQNEPMPVIEKKDIKIIPIDIHNGTCKFDLLLNIFEADNGLVTSFEYSTALFNKETIKRLLRHYKILLENIVENPDQRIGCISMLDKHEKQMLLEEWNNTQYIYDAETPLVLHRLIENQVQKTPDRIALKFNQHVLTYQELNHKANQLANYLRSLGVTSNTVIAVCMERSMELVIGLLAVLKAGAAYIPLDEEYPEARLSYMLENSGAKIVLCNNRIPSWMDASRINIVCVSTQNNLYEEFEQTNLSSMVNPADMSYVIYTSGSTGRPKGAMNSHKGICNRLLWMQNQYKLESKDAVLQKTPFSFDVSVWEFFWPLIAGAKLVIAPPGAHRDSSWLAKIIQEEEISVMHFVPSMLRIFISDTTTRMCHSLRKIFCSGEALPFDLKNAFQAKFPSVELHNLYGPTEAAIDVTFWDCSQSYEKPMVPIGKPIANTQIYILDHFRVPTPLGVPGELYIGGDAVGLGYINNETLSHERFVSNIFSCDSNAKLYKTGDSARFHSDGIIEFLGRSDDQIKIRGFRIELQEIEALLTENTEIATAAVTVDEGYHSQKNLIAYVVPSSINEVNSLSCSSDFSSKISSWNMVFETTYKVGQNQRTSPLRNFAGWKSSYTGEQINDDEMNEWLDVTLERIRLHKPRRVLEIGCGMGLLLLELAKERDLYVGTDISSSALRYIEKTLSDYSYDRNKVKLFNCAADDLSELSVCGQFDFIILNSVIQYFPSVNYLTQVLEKLFMLVKPGGHIFLGDVKNYALMESFYMSTALFQLGKDIPVSSLRSHIETLRLTDQELSIAPQFFECLTRLYDDIHHVSIQLRRGQHQNEMSKYRYDVVLKIKTTQKNHVINEFAMDKFKHFFWQIEDEPSQQLNALLENNPNTIIYLSDIPNERVFKEVMLEKMLKKIELEKNLLIREFVGMLETPAEKIETLNPESLWRQWQEKYTIILFWAKSNKKENIDAVFLPGSTGEKDISLLLNKINQSHDLLELRNYASNPFEHEKNKALIKRLQAELRIKLPEYMMPAQFIILDKMPLSANGKIDRKQLPKAIISRKDSQNDVVIPVTEKEKAIAKIWSELFLIPAIGTTDNFFELGGNSLLAAQMILKVRDQCHANIPLRMVFQYPTIKGLISYLTNNVAINEEYKKSVWHKMQRDCFLPAGIKTSQRMVAPDEVSSIFITGVTGFLGIYLLCNLLQHTRATILCLIRAENEHFAKQKLKQTLHYYRLNEKIDYERIRIICGDLAKPYFGLIHKDYGLLASQAEMIYHCGAAVNFMASYDELHAANVMGTVEIFRLAVVNRGKPVHFISSIYTLTDADRNSASESHLNENHTPRHGYYHHMGYLQTKWVAERLAEAARDRGVFVNIYRPGRISGDTISGACQQNDFYWGLVGACLKLNTVPATGLEENLLPVDYVANAIVQLSLKHKKINQNYHLINHHTIPQSLLITALQTYGYKIKVLSYEEWKTIAVAKAQLSPDDPFSKLAGFVFNENDVTEPLFTSNKTREYLQEIGLQDNPEITNALIHSYINFFVTEGFFPAPMEHAEKEGVSE
jgi:amino acid adenylation domain-containing protein/thioester reductase-like protein